MMKTKKPMTPEPKTPCTEDGNECVGNQVCKPFMGMLVCKDMKKTKKPTMMKTKKPMTPKTPCTENGDECDGDQVCKTIKNMKMFCKDKKKTKKPTMMKTKKPMT